LPTFLAQIPPPPVSGFELGPLDVRLYGILIAIGAYLALRMGVARYERFGGDPEVAERTALWILGAGFLGARIGYVIPRVGRFVDDPLAVFAIWEGGLALFGGLFAGTLVGYLLLRGGRGKVPAFMDAVAPAVPLAQAIGRWGNYFNQELYGRPTDLPWAVRIEPEFRRPGFEDVATFHPTFLYESLGNLVLVVVLLRLDRAGRLRRGSLLWIYAIGYGIIRALTEALRIDTDFRILGLSRNNWIALLVILAAVAGLRWWQRRPVPDLADGDVSERKDEDLDDVAADDGNDLDEGGVAADEPGAPSEAENASLDHHDGDGSR
jgi:prolipoprotein diacylglyceryl transferase